MTTVYESAVASSNRTACGTHVFIVGVGEYPALLGGDRKLLLNKPMSLEQLSSPPVAAAALASWFLGRVGAGAQIGFHNPGAPLATVEMLLSPRQSYRRPDGTTLDIESATRSKIAQSFARWRERAALHDENVAVFYFCGHGVMGANDYLLPSDFGVVNPDNPWADAIDITETARAMRRLVSGPLYFFIDACRQGARDALSPGAAPPALAPVDFDKPVCGFSRLILWASGEGEAAFGASGRVSRFCAALVEALSGYRAEEAPGGAGWMVTSDVLQRSVSTILEEGNAPLGQAEHQYVERQLIGSQLFHLETERPRNVSVGAPSHWSVSPDIRKMLKGWGVAEGLPNNVLEVLAEQLEAKNLQVETLRTEVRDWKRRYVELVRNLDADRDSALSRRARELLDAGKMQEAGIAYDDLIRAATTRREAESKLIARYNLDRGRIFRLDFKPLEAVPLYRAAYELCPDDPEYALPYAELLSAQRDYRKAEPVYVAALDRLRELAGSEPGRHRERLANALNELGLLFTKEHRYAEAAKVFSEALTTFRNLPAVDPATFLPDVAGTLSNLGFMHAEEHRDDEALKAYTEALATFRDLARTNPAAYHPNVATTLNNLGLLHSEARRAGAALDAYTEALAIRRELAKTNPAAYRPNVATTLNNLGLLHAATDNDGAALDAYTEALAIRRDLAKTNPAAYRPNLATTLNNLGVLYAKQHRDAAAIDAYTEALAIRRDLAATNLAAYRPNVATTLNNLGLLHAEAGRVDAALDSYGEALATFRDLAKTNPAAYLPDVARTLKNLGLLHAKQARNGAARGAYEEALQIYNGSITRSPERFRQDLEQVRKLLEQLPE